MVASMVRLPILTEKETEMNAKTRHVVSLKPDYKSLTIEEKVDELGELRAALQPLINAQKELEKDVKADGRTEINGSKYRATVSFSERATVAWKKIAEKLGASKQIIIGNTSKSKVTSLRVTALPKS